MPWFTYSVGGAIISDNTFNNTYTRPDDTSGYIRARGTYDNSQFDWASYWSTNIFTNGAVIDTIDGSPGNLQTYSYPGYYGTFNNVRRIGAGIQGELDHAQSGDTVLVAPGTYEENIIIDTPLTLRSVGGGRASTFIDASVTGNPFMWCSSAPVTSHLDGFDISSPGYTGARTPPASWWNHSPMDRTPTSASPTTSSTTSAPRAARRWPTGMWASTSALLTVLRWITTRSTTSCTAIRMRGRTGYPSGAAAPAHPRTISSSTTTSFTTFPLPIRRTPPSPHRRTLAGNVTVYNNSLISTLLHPTEFGVEVRGSNIVNALNNWWGDASGPFDNSAVPDRCGLLLDNPSGTGSAVTPCVIYENWLTADPLAEPENEPGDDGGGDSDPKPPTDAPGAGLPIFALPVTGGQTQTLDCSLFSATYLSLANGDAVTISCPVAGTASLKGLTADDLPGTVPDGNAFGSALTVQLSAGEANLPGTITVSFNVSGKTGPFAMLHWDGTSWVDVPGILTADGHYEAIVDFAGTFLLVSK